MKYKIKILLLLLNFLMPQTSDQIKKAVEIVKKTGMSEAEARKAAKSRGFSDKQINDAINKEIGSRSTKDLNIEKVIVPDIDKSNQVMHDNSSIPGENELSLINEVELPIIKDNDFKVIDENIHNTSSSEEGKKQSYYGYHIFKRDPALFQASSLGAVDPDYLIGPGDEIIVMMWGETQFRQVIQVDREGFVFIPEVGQVFVNGLTLALLESKLFRVLSQSYASLNPQGRKSTTFLDISLGNLRPLRIQVLGEVSQPGAYTVTPSATLFSSLYYFNGPTVLGSLRDIKLIRGGKEIATIDFYDYLLTGKKLKDQKLQLDDVVFIPKRLKTVSIEGEINRPGIYELKANEYLLDLIGISGSLVATAYLERAQIDRIVPFEKREELGVDRMITDVALDEVLKSKKEFVLQDGDKVKIFSVLDMRNNIVEVEGAITRPGDYDIGDSLTLAELIEKADGLLGDAYMQRVDIVRVKPDFTQKLIKLDLDKVLNNDPDHDIKLKGLDRVTVYGMTEMIEESFVSIGGSVKTPGRFLLQENMTVYDLIFKSGGFIDESIKRNAYLKRAELIRINKIDGKKEIISFSLESILQNKGIASKLLHVDDHIKIYSKKEIEGASKYISISGNVKRPGQYELFESNMTVYDILFKAGGFQDLEYKASTFLGRADLIRLDNDQITRSIIPFNLGEVLEDENHYQNFKLKSGDHIKIFSNKVFNTVRSVSVDGVIRNPGRYELKTGMTIKDLILEAGGVTEDVYRYKIEIARIDPDKVKEDLFAEMIDLDMLSDYSLTNDKSILDTNSKSYESQEAELYLKPYDYISIRPDPYFKMQRQIKIVGAVYYPGMYTITGPEENIADIINRAGGLRSNAYAFGSSFIREGKKVQINLEMVLKKPHLDINITVQDGDQIQIAEHPEMIEVVGEVSTPGFYKYKKGLRIRDVLNQAGGFSQDVAKDNIFVRYPNGVSKKYTKFMGNHKVLDGSVLFVGKIKEVEPFDKTEYAKEVTNILVNIVQAVSVILIAQR